MLSSLVRSVLLLSPRRRISPAVLYFSTGSGLETSARVSRQLTLFTRAMLSLLIFFVSAAAPSSTNVRTWEVACGYTSISNRLPSISSATRILKLCSSIGMASSESLRTRSSNATNDSFLLRSRASTGKQRGGQDGCSRCRHGYILSAVMRPGYIAAHDPAGLSLRNCEELFHRPHSADRQLG